MKKNERKIIFATDIAETSITIDGITFIVDSGFTKNLVFDSTRNITSLKVKKHKIFLESIKLNGWFTFVQRK